MSWQNIINAGVNAFGLMAFLKSLDRLAARVEDPRVLRFAYELESPTEDCKERTWVIRMERDDAPVIRVRGKGNRAVHGKEGRMVGSAVRVADVAWAPIVWDGSLMPQFVQAQHVELIEEPQ